ncbi:hypothetical protein GUJ93_ZPchr0337g7098 [Zizania palustris]|uniref:Uncharacterized protein n=1 Tax=Zizania palustris TaxID=103762 RepID=A0A8J5R5B8_ZIZPA|nr:hypothetical protein GUJ93_ZPchr0337g7098 [Zizania palustris]
MPLGRPTAANLPGRCLLTHRRTPTGPPALVAWSRRPSVLASRWSLSHDRLLRTHHRAKAHRRHCSTILSPPLVTSSRVHRQIRDLDGDVPSLADPAPHPHHPPSAPRPCFFRVIRASSLLFCALQRAVRASSAPSARAQSSAAKSRPPPPSSSGSLD